MLLTRGRNTKGNEGYLIWLILLMKGQIQWDEELEISEPHLKVNVLCSLPCVVIMFSCTICTFLVHSFANGSQFWMSMHYNSTMATVVSIQAIVNIHDEKRIKLSATIAKRLALKHLNHCSFIRTASDFTIIFFFSLCPVQWRPVSIDYAAFLGQKLDMGGVKRLLNNCLVHLTIVTVIAPHRLRCSE